MNIQHRNVRRIVHDIAHARAGDKGNTSNVNVWVYDPADYDLLRRTLTPERIKREFPHLIRGDVTRYEIPHLHGFAFASWYHTHSTKMEIASVSRGSISCSTLIFAP